MRGLRVLITNNTLAGRAGSELYVRDLAVGLLERGHTPIAYSLDLGEVAQEIRAVGIPVVADLNALAVAPDVIHGHHNLETMIALLHFPGVPAVNVCHGWLPWQEAPARFPRSLRYVAVGDQCRDRLVLEHAIPEDRVQVVPNFVDLVRFQPRAPLPPRLRRALVFNNYAREETYLPALREACARRGIELEVLGAGVGKACAQPEKVLGNYDLVLASGRSALEALAVGAAVILCHSVGAGPLVTSAELERLRALNFGLRAFSDPVRADVVGREIDRYDPLDATEVCRRVRATAGLDTALDEIISLYRAVLAEQAARDGTDTQAEGRAAAAYLTWLAPMVKESQILKGRANKAEQARGHLLMECDRYENRACQAESECDRLRNECNHLTAALVGVYNSTAVRLRTRILDIPLLGSVAGALARFAAGRASR